MRDTHTYPMCLCFPCFRSLQAILVGGNWRALCRHQGCSLIAGLLLTVRIVHERDHCRLPREHSQALLKAVGTSREEGKKTVNTTLQITESLKRIQQISAGRLRHTMLLHLLPTADLSCPQPGMTICSAEVAETAGGTVISKMQHYRNLCFFTTAFTLAASISPLPSVHLTFHKGGFSALSVCLAGARHSFTSHTGCLSESSESSALTQHSCEHQQGAEVS